MKKPTDVSLKTVARFPLPSLQEATDKDARGAVLVIAGGPLAPGAGLLTGTAALRAGAGKLKLAATAQSAMLFGVAMPEAAVIKTPSTRGGDFGPSAASALRRALKSADAVIIGPGMNEGEATDRLAALLFAPPCKASVVLDAGAMTGLDLKRPWTRNLDGRIVMTPHAGEMASLLGRSKSAVLDDPLGAARTLSDATGATVVMKGPETFIVTPDGAAFRHVGGVVGLGTSGSGDVLAGIIGGVLARGADPVTAALWGVCVHAGAGVRLTEEIGPVGFLAREILGEIAGVMAQAQ